MIELRKDRGYRLLFCLKNVVRTKALNKPGALPHLNYLFAGTVEVQIPTDLDSGPPFVLPEFSA